MSAAAMPSVHRGGQPAGLRLVPHAMPGLLHPAGAQRAPGQAPRPSHVGSHRSCGGCAGQGHGACVRAADIDETTLSLAEIHHGLVHGLLLDKPRLPDLLQEEINRHRATKKETT